MSGKRAIIWTAVSSEEQAADEKESLQHQERLGREAAAKHGLDVVDVIRSDDSRSIVRLDVAMRNERLGYARLMDALDRRALDVLIYYNTDRLGRNHALSVTVQESCREAGVVLYDLSSPPHELRSEPNEADRFVGAMQAVMAQSEVDKFRKRSRFGRDARARRGMFAGLIPYGYQRADDGRIVLDDAAAAVLRRIFAEYLRGHGLPRLAADLNADGIPAPRGGIWQIASLADIFNNVLRYAGYLEHNQHSRKHRDNYMRVRGAWPPLIDDATAERIQAERRARAANRRLADTPHLLAGVVWCMDCNQAMRVCTVRARPGKPQVYIYLRCGQHHQHPFWQVRTDDVLAYVFDIMAELTEQDIDKLLAGDTVQDNTQADIDAAAREVARLRKSMQAADDAHFVAGTLDADRYARTVTRLQTEIANRQTEIARLEAKLRQEAERGSKRDRLLDVLHNGPTILRGADPTAANVWLREHVRVWAKDKRVLIAEWL